MTTECARCGHRGLTEGDVCIREWEGDSDAPMCAPCWDETEQEEDEGEELLVCYFCGRDEKECKANADKDNGNPITNWVGWGLSCDECYYRWNADTEDEDEDEEETEADKLKSLIKHLLGDLNRLEGADGVEKFLNQVLRK